MADPKVTLDADAKRLLREFEKVSRVTAKLTQELKKTAAAGQVVEKSHVKAGRAGNKAFGSGAIASLRNYAIGFVGIQRAVQAVTQALTEMSRVRMEAGQREQEARIGMGSLAQLAETPAEMKKYAMMARVASMQGAGDKGEAAGLVFRAISAGITKQADVDLLAQLKGQGLVDQPGLLATGANTMMTSMPGETGGFRAIVSKAFAASKGAPSQVEELLEGASRSATSAGLMGISDEEILAMIPIIASAKGGAETGGTYMAQMMRSFKQRGVAGGTLREKILNVPAAAEVGEKTGPARQQALKEWFGRAQGQEAWEVISQPENLAKYDAMLTSVHEAQATDRVGMKLALAQHVPELAAANLARIEKAKREAQETRMGTYSQLADSLEEDLVVDLRNRGRGELKVWAARKLWSQRRWGGGDEAFVNEFREFARPELEEKIQNTQARAAILERVMDNMTEGANRMAGAAEKLDRRGPSTLAHPDSDPK